MLTAIKHFLLGIYLSVKGLIVSIGRCTRYLLKTVLGLSWEAPTWARQLSRSVTHREGNTPHSIMGMVMGLALAVLLCTGAYMAINWVNQRPKPHAVSFTVVAPDLTEYREKPIVVHPLRIEFSESAAPLDAMGKPVEHGISLTPPLSGTWSWTDDSTLTFRPKGDWPVDTSYRIQLTAHSLLSQGTVLQSQRGDFRTAPFTAEVIDTELYQDPRDPGIQKLIATLEFSHPIDEDSVRKRAAIELDRGLQYRDLNAPTPPVVTSDSVGLRTFVQSAALAVPLEGTYATVVVKSGVRSRLGGNQADKLQAREMIPGRYQLSFSNARIIFADNMQGEPEPTLIVGSNNAIADIAIADKVQAWLLPSHNRENSTYWSKGDITESVLAKSEPVALSHVPSAEPLNITHAFKLKVPAGRYLYVKVAPQIQSLGGLLNKDASTSVVRMPQYPVALRLMSEGILLSLSGDRKLGFTVRGIDEVHMEIARLLPGQLHHLVDQNNGSLVKPEMENWDFDRLVERETRIYRALASDPAQTRYEHVDLNEYFSADSGRQGVFVLRLSDKSAVQNNSSTFTHNGEHSDWRLIVVTDLGIIAKHSADGSSDVFVQSIRSGHPVANAKIQVVGRNGIPVAEGQTDQDGRAHFAKLGELKREKTPLMYIVIKDGDMSFLPIERNNRQLNFSRFDVGGMYDHGDPDALQAYVFSDRGLYRPGESVNLGMIVRNANWSGAWKDMPLELLISDPRGMPVQRKLLHFSSSGLDGFNFVTSEVSPTGTYMASLSLVGEKNKDERIQIGSTTFIVRDFEPDRMKVHLSLHETPVTGWLKPEQVKAQLETQHLFGAPASDRRVTAEMSFAPAFASFARWADYSFHLSDAMDNFSTETLPQQTTDEQGAARFDLQLNRFANATYRLRLTANVFEAEGGRNVAAQTSVMVASADYLVGVKSVDDLGFVPMNARREVHWQAIAQDLEPTAVQGLVTELVEHRYVSVLVKQSDGNYRYESRLRDFAYPGEPLMLDVNGATQKLITSEPGDFSVVLKDAQGRMLNKISYSVAGKGNASRALDRNAELKLKLDKPSYRPGEEIAISIRAPYAGAGLITIERDKVYAQQWFKTGSTSSVQHIRLPAGLEGNAYINVQFVRDIGSPEVYMSPLSYGVVPFSVDLGSRRVQLGIQSSKTVEPGQNLEITVSSDRPARAVIYAVDEGILQVARYRTPDPLGHFFQKRALEVNTSQILDLILPEFNLLLSASAPGGDGEAALAAHLNPFKRKRKPPVAWWSGIVDLPQGQSTFQYTAPDYFSGRLRLFVVAATEDGIGVAENATEVRGPLVMTPNVPAFVAPGDEFSVSAGIFSNLEKVEDVRYSLQTSAGLQVLNAESATILRIEPLKEGVAEFRIRAQEPLGSAELQFIATLPSGKTIQTEETISVRPASVHRTHLQLGAFTQKQKGISPSRDLFGEFRKVQLNAGASPLAWGGGLETFLKDYSFSCTEQIVSRGMPSVIWANDRDSTQMQQTQEQLNKLLQTLRARQNQQGGFGLFAAQLDVDSFVTLYVTDFLLEAQEQGFDIPKDMLDRANAYLTEVASAPSNGVHELRNRAYASYLLTRQGVVNSAALADIRERLETRDAKNWRQDIAALWLAGSYQLLQQTPQANEIMTVHNWKLLEPAWSSDGMYYDSLVHDATHLQLLSRHFPQLLVKLSGHVLENMGARLNESRYNSLTAALLIRSLNSYDAQVSDQMTLHVKAFFDQTHQTQALTLQGKPPQTEVPLGATGLMLEKAGNTAVYYMLSEAGFDRKINIPAMSQGLEIQHDYLNLKGEAVQKVTVGDEFLVRLRLRALDRNSVQQVAVIDLLPGGVEPVLRAPDDSADNAHSRDDDEFDEDDGRSDRWQAPVGESRMSNWQPYAADVRDDRLVLYGDVSHSVNTFVYRVRATNAGTFVTPAAYAESMYDTQIQARSKTGQLEIVAAP